MDRIASDNPEQCRIVHLSQFAKMRARSSSSSGENKTLIDTSKPERGELAEVIHVCPGYATGFNFYQAELAEFSQVILTRIVTLLSDRDFDSDQRWELLQLVTQANFQKLAPADQGWILNMVSRNPALAIHLLLASLNNRLRKRTNAGEQDLTSSAEFIEASMGAEVAPEIMDSATGFEGRRYPSALYDDIRFTLHLLLDAKCETKTASAYMDLVAKPGFIGVEGELGLFLNRLIQQDLVMISSEILEQLASLVSDGTFCFLPFRRQCLLLGTLRNLAVLEWPDAVEHLSVLAEAFKSANRVELAALQSYFDGGAA